MHTTYFTETIQNWQDWAAVFQSISVFEPLIRAILQKEKLPLGKVTQLTPGTNAVFRVEQLVIKIYAPKESGMDQTSDQKTELFARGTRKRRACARLKWWRMAACPIVMTLHICSCPIWKGKI